MSVQFGESLILPRADGSYITEWRRSIDWPILIAACTLLGLGLMLSLAAGPPAAERIGLSDPFHFFKRHCVFAVLGFGALIATSMLDRVWSRRMSAVIFCGSFVMLAALLVIGFEAKGAQRWIQLGGFTLQPSEFAKPALIVLSGWLLAQRQQYPGGPWAVVSLVFFVVTLGLLLLQPDVGQSALLTASFIVTFFVSGLPWKWAVAFFSGGVGLSAALYASLPHVRHRVNSFLNPSEYDTYQIDKASEAIARGGFLGTGPGEGTVKSHLPDAHTDFIYAVLGEEFGYIAALVLIGLYVFICWRGFRAAARLNDPYPRAAAAGLFALFGLQAAINIAVNVSLIPPKGMTLPFISYGGSSMLGIALTLGLALALIRRQGGAAWRANG
ncbi:putative lipid II flippase FtsW [Henriciella sp.]|uniref:putative lipid II flippase FtsW n=1 Tax=Henriciella sp. TaxID=1968823 RepID=UPI00262A2750|nr:putative lipid II flippase FtsW [Henriciella sp.]